MAAMNEVNPPAVPVPEPATEPPTEPPVASATRAPDHGWWRRNAVALIALLVLVPAAAAAIGWQEWNDYFGPRHPRVVSVAPGETVELADAQVGPATLVAVPADVDLDAPAGARVLAAQLTVVPGETPLSCLTPTLVETTTDRTWSAQFGPIGWEGDSSCFEDTTPLWINVPFVVPADAGPFAIEFEALHAGDERLLLQVEQP